MRNEELGRVSEILRYRDAEREKCVFVPFAFFCGYFSYFLLERSSILLRRSRIKRSVVLF